MKTLCKISKIKFIFITCNFWEIAAHYGYLMALVIFVCKLSPNGHTLEETGLTSFAYFQIIAATELPFVMI